MRLLQISIPRGKKEAMLSVLDDEDIEYVVTDETGGNRYVAVVYVPLPINAVEPVLDDLREVGLKGAEFTVVVDAETVNVPGFDALEERYLEAEEAGTRETRIAREELHTKAAELAPSFHTYTLLTVVSAMVATAGLLIDSPATVVGSMVIAPLIGPAMAASVGTVLNDRELFLRGAKLQAIGLLLAIVSATALAFVARSLFLPQTLDITALGEISERLTPGVLTLVVALGAGLAGAISLSAGVATAIVGVMIAVALIPPAAVVGIGIAWGLPVVSLGAALLTLVNTLSINLAAIALLWYRGYAPENVLLRNAARSATLKRLAVLVAVILVLSLVLGAITFDSLEKSKDRQAIDDGVDEIVGNYEALVVIETRVSHENGSFFRPPTQVVVVVGHPPGHDPPAIAGEIKSRADRISDGDVAVRVRYVTIERAG